MFKEMESGRMDTRELKWENMLAGITAQPAFLRDGAARRLHESASNLPIRLPSRIYLVGCGDSHYAGLATRFAFERWSGIPTEALEAFEFARYAVADAPSDALVIGVSNSGRALRTTECTRVARERGIVSIGLTHNPSSPLAEAATMLLPNIYVEPGTPTPSDEPKFETLSYLASLTGLYALALRLGELSRRLEDAAVSSRLEALAAVGDDIAHTLEASREVAALAAANLPTRGLINVLGAGPNYATALLSVALFIEAAGYPAAGIELEEWAHEQYWCTRPGTATLVVAPPGASLDRAREQLRAIRDRGGFAVAICSADDAETCALGDAVLPVVAPTDELISPLVTAIPLELISFEFAQRVGWAAGDSDDEKRRVFNVRQQLIFGSPDADLARR
jgi:glucosamine--fructose-6-phosphate aminotransferase (isomerizing)